MQLSRLFSSGIILEEGDYTDAKDLYWPTLEGFSIKFLQALFSTGPPNGSKRSPAAAAELDCSRTHALCFSSNFNTLSHVSPGRNLCFLK